MTKDRHPSIVHWTDIEEEPGRYKGDDEPLAHGAPLGRHFGFTRLGIHHERLPPGHRTSRRSTTLA